MSRFLTCWHRAGVAVPESMIALADRWLARDGRTVPRRIVRGEIACWHWPGAWAPGAEDALPLDRDGWVGSGVMRLDDRDTLARRLRDRGNDGAQDDASLAWRSLATWGDHAAREWSGDYALAAVSASRGRLVAARSPFGVRACFHVNVGEITCVSDDLSLLVALTGARREPPDEAVAEYLRYGRLVTPTLTFHRGVARIPAAYTLVVERGGAARLSRHWTLPTPDIRYEATEGELLAEFHQVLDQAVRDRLRAPRAVLMLSGGLDSSALAIAARRAAPRIQLHAFTGDWSSLVADDEAEFAGMAAAAAGIPHEIVRRQADPELGEGAPFATPEPVPDPEPRLTRQDAVHLAALAPVALVGDDADTLLMSPTLLEQLRSQGVVRTAREWGAHLRRTGERPWLGIRRDLARVVGGEAQDEESAPTWLRAPFASVTSATPGAYARIEHPSRPRTARALADPLWDANAWINDPAMSGVDLVTLLPFMDPRVIRFCLSLPAVPWLQSKYLLRRAFRDSLPPALLERPKTPLRGYYAARVARWRAAGAPAPLPHPVDHWVDRSKWEAVMKYGTDADTVFAAWRVLELSRWLAQRDA
ncbi:MAG: asparagine synthase-related protein [Gemmatimonadaceae bacterium]